jgi:rubredoxin
MKIIKEGLPKEKLKKVLKKTKRFSCKVCGCVFEADDGEYSVSSEYGFYTVRTCVCPNCQSVASETPCVAYLRHYTRWDNIL